MTASSHSTRSVAGLLFCTGLLLAAQAPASVLTFTDRTAWESAAGPLAFTENFEGFAGGATPSDLSFNGGSQDIGPFTLSAPIPTFGTSNLIDLQSDNGFVLPGRTPASFGAVTAFLFVDNTAFVDMLFDTPVTALFADFQDAGNTDELSMVLELVGGGSETIQVPGPGTDLVPFGFVSTAGAVSSIRFTNSLNDGFLIDNISASTTAVPEPPTLGLALLAAALAAGGTALGARGRTRPAA